MSQIGHSVLTYWSRIIGRLSVRLKKGERKGAATRLINQNHLHRYLSACPFVSILLSILRPEPYRCQLP